MDHRFRDPTTVTYLPSSGIVASEIPLHLRICHPVRATFQKFMTITYLLARGSADSEIPRQLRICNPEKATFQRFHDVYVSSTSGIAASKIPGNLHICHPVSVSASQRGHRFRDSTRTTYRQARESLASEIPRRLRTC